MTFTMKIAAPLAALALISTPAFTQTSSADVKTVATADIAGPVTAEDLAEGTVVMATTGEIVGKVVSTVEMEGGGTDLIIQVEGTASDSPEKNVALPIADFMTSSDGNYVVDATMEEFLVLVDEQNPG